MAENTETRASGFYWVREETGDPYVAQWDADAVWNCWWVPGSDMSVDDESLVVISERLDPPAKTTKARPGEPERASSAEPSGSTLDHSGDVTGMVA